MPWTPSVTRAPFEKQILTPTLHDQKGSGEHGRIPEDCFDARAETAEAERVAQR